MSVKTVDFYNLGNFRNTTPISLSFYEEIYTGFEYWTELYIKFFELALGICPEKVRTLARLDRKSGGSSVLFIENEEIVPVQNYRNLGDTNICLKKYHYDADRLLGLLKELVEQCDLDVSRIEIKYRAKDKSTSNDNYFETLSAVPENDSLFTNNFNRHNLATTYNSPPPLYSSLQNYIKFDGYPSKYVAERITRILKNDYVQGFRFDDTTLGLLESRAYYTLNYTEQKILKSKMYCRKDDGLYFLNESVASEDLCLRIAESANVALQKFQCFELKTLYKRFSAELNPCCIRNVEDFEDWFGGKFSGNFRVKNYDLAGEHRLVRVKSISQEEATSALVRKIDDELKKSFGTLEEDRLQTIFDAFSIELLNDLVRKETDDVIVCQINGRTSYQTFEALGIPEELPEELSNALEKIDELELEPNLETINALLSVAFDYNFRNNFNIPNDRTYRRLIATYYQGVAREWKAGTFKEIDE